MMVFDLYATLEEEEEVAAVSSIEAVDAASVVDDADDDVAFSSFCSLCDEAVAAGETFADVEVSGVDDADVDDVVVVFFGARIIFFR